MEASPVPCASAAPWCDAHLRPRESPVTTVCVGNVCLAPTLSSLQLSAKNRHVQGHLQPRCIQQPLSCFLPGRVETRPQWLWDKPEWSILSLAGILDLILRDKKLRAHLGPRLAGAGGHMAHPELVPNGWSTGMETSTQACLEVDSEQASRVPAVFLAVRSFTSRPASVPLLIGALADVLFSRM